ncbi:LacI family DNA-binding transcriptional regulator [Pseudactinotalea suaedae]|uniref:LacI family DNA-binding transcriptional regulator n=1 Tax=Pseudactinotalea suaedae TaxID=1524924 RepID=UPI0012E15EFE|nr:LacI family DNA-binding transcriptional regulator [Pseudactinotalea suaedae]
MTREAKLADVARAAQVSVATASRALAGATVVAAATRERVRRAAVELGYEPNLAARQLVTGMGQSIALVIPDLANPFYAGVAKGVQRRVRAEGLTAVVADTDEDAATEAAVVAQVGPVASRLVLASPRMPDEAVHEIAHRARVVLVNRAVDGVAAVTGDNADGVRQALVHLHALGHRRIGYAGGPATSWSDAARRRGLSAAQDQLPGLAVVDLGSFRPGSSGGVSAADLALAADVTAVLAFNDQLALGILGRLADRGVPVPGRLSVVGFDDIPVARLLAPSLTSVAVSAEALGRTAVELLLGPDRPDPGLRTLPVELAVRRSTAEPAVG